MSKRFRGRDANTTRLIKTKDYQKQQMTSDDAYRVEARKGGKMKTKTKNKNLKPIDKKKNPGLAKLPTQVRNKMGYMAKGGKVSKSKMKKKKYV